MIDIHCHILPGIDDGPETMKQSIEMARAAVESGITTVVATPHLRADFPRVKVDELAERVAELGDELDRAGIELELIAGGEVGLSWALEADDLALKRASYGQNGRDVLIETPTTGGALLPSLLARVAARGYRVVLAHPERLPDFQADPRSLVFLAERGVCLEVNADSLTANPRRTAYARLARWTLDQGLISVVASDAHRGLDWRPITTLAEARGAVAQRLGESEADHLMVFVPQAILTGEAIPAAPGRRVGPRPRSWNR